MPAAVETAAFSNTPAWHKLGNVIDTAGDKGMTITVALEQSGLDWDVQKVPAYAPTEYVQGANGLIVPAPDSPLAPIPNRWNVQRLSDKRFFGTVGETWHPTQNREGFAVVDDIIKIASNDLGTTWIEAAGAIDEGRKVWILAHIENDWQIAGEKYDQYLLFLNGFDGRTSLQMLTTDVRAVCKNTIALAKMTSDRVVKVRHTVNAPDRIKQAIHMLGMRNKYNEELALRGEMLAETSISEGEFEQFLASLMPIKDGTPEKAPARTMIEKRRDQVREIYMEAPNLQPIRGTRWGVLQAAIEYADYGRRFEDDQTQLVAQFGLNTAGTDIKDRAMAIVESPDLKLAVA